MTTGSSSAANALVEMVRSYQVSQALYVAAVLGVADQLADGPRDCASLAQAVGAHADSLYRVLRTLASRGVFVEHPDRRYGLNDMSLPLRSDVPGSVRAYLILWGHPMQWLPWGRLIDSVCDGTPVFNEVFGASHYAYLESHPEDAAVFRAAMAGIPAHVEFVRTYDASTLREFVDVGGGVGRLCTALLQANPDCRGVLLDQPSVVAQAAEVLCEGGVAERCRLIGGDFHTDIPPGADAYILSNVIMDQTDDAALQLLRSCREAMAADGRIVIIERVIPAGNPPSLAHLSDLMCLAVVGGRIRSQEELDAMFAESRLRRTNSYDLPSGYSVVEARAA